MPVSWRLISGFSNLIRMVSFISKRLMSFCLRNVEVLFTMFLSLNLNDGFQFDVLFSPIRYTHSSSPAQCCCCTANVIHLTKHTVFVRADELINHMLVEFNIFFFSLLLVIIN